MLKPTYAIPVPGEGLMPYRLTQLLLDLAFTEQFQGIMATISSQITHMISTERIEDIKADKLLQEYMAGERNFQQANLQEVNLQGVDLRGINLSQANLRGG